MKFKLIIFFCIVSGVLNAQTEPLQYFRANNKILKAEYVNQLYKNFKSTDIRAGGEFDGFMIEASIGF